MLNIYEVINVKIGIIDILMKILSSMSTPPFSFNIKENGTWSVHFFCTFPDGTKHKNPILKEN